MPEKGCSVRRTPVNYIGDGTILVAWSRLYDLLEQEINKPWISEAIKNEIMKKHKLYQKAKKSNEETDWNEFKEQKNKVVTMISSSKLEYIGNHPEEGARAHYCETCDRDMKTAAMLAQHIQEHSICGIDGRYPSKENVERHKAEQQEKQQRGEHLDRPKKRFNEYVRDKGLRGNRRGGRGRTQHRRHRGRPRDVDDSSLGTLPLYNKEEWRGGLPAFLGTAVFHEEVEVVDAKVDADQFSDTEWEGCSEKSVKTPAKSATTVPVVSNILSALMSCYASDHTDSEGNLNKHTIHAQETSSSERVARQQIKVYHQGSLFDLYIQKPSPSIQTYTRLTTSMVFNDSQQKLADDVIDVPKVNSKVLTTQNESNSSASLKNCPIETNNKIETVRDETPDVSKLVIDETRDGHNVGNHHDAPNGINLLTNKETPSLPAEPETPHRSGSEPDEAPITFEKLDHTQNHEETNNGGDSNSRTLNNGTQLGGRKNPRKRQRHNRGRTDENTESRQEVQQTDRGQKGDFHQNKRGNTSIYVRRRRPTLLEKLLGNEIRHERNAILQCVRYVVQNNFLELRSSISQATKDETADVQKVSKTNILAQCIHHIVHNKLIEEIVPFYLSFFPIPNLLVGPPRIYYTPGTLPRWVSHRTLGLIVPRSARAPARAGITLPATWGGALTEISLHLLSTISPPADLQLT
uniref:C2H2-type domain-containing protein n=1 Tax=Timema monikensis TaxID=170555 RepID=A0A7R9EJ89_9NEOP|nr:unnamed protein product [Timema monikensis]